MAISRTVNFLPEYFATIPNARFLSSTLDRLVSAPLINRFDGYIGRRFNNGVPLTGAYLVEDTATRTTYQLEPNFVTYDQNQNVSGVVGFDDVLNAAANKGGFVTGWNRLLTGNMYTWHGFVDLDKLINFQNYSWMPQHSDATSWFWNNAIQITGGVDTSTIIGQVEYTSPNGIVLANGLHIALDSNPNDTWIVEGVGTAISLVPVHELVVAQEQLLQGNPADYITINRASLDRNPWSRSNQWFLTSSIDAAATYLINQGTITSSQVTSPAKAVRPIIEFFAGIKPYGMGEIALPAIDLFDSYSVDVFNTVQGQPAYTVDSDQVNQGQLIVFNADKNQLVRGNIYEVQFVDITSTSPVNRLSPVVAAATDNITLSGLQSVDGVQLNVGDRVLVANQTNSEDNGIYSAAKSTWSRTTDFDTDAAFESSFGVYVLHGATNINTYFKYTGTPTSVVGQSIFFTTGAVPVINLLPTYTAAVGNNTFVTAGQTFLDAVVVWDSITQYWAVAAQYKSSVQQQPLFDIVDINGNSFSDGVIYPETTFIGSKLFSYAIDINNPLDQVLGLPIVYGNVGNLGDITFDNNYETDIFNYQNTSGNITPLDDNTGTAVHIDPNTGAAGTYDPWTYVDSNLELYQNIEATGITQIQFIGKLLAKSKLTAQPVQIFVDGIQIDTGDFTVTQIINAGVSTITIVITTPLLTATSTVLIKVLSSIPISGAFYDVPPAFEKNPFGQDLTTFTTTTLRNHAETTVSNVNEDIIDFNLNQAILAAAPGSILVHEPISLLPALLLTNSKFDIDTALRTAADDYVLFKQKFLNIATQIENIANMTGKTAVDQVFAILTAPNSPTDAWFSSDMVPFGGVKTSYTIVNDGQTTFTVKLIHNLAAANNIGLLVYLNDTQLMNGIDYTTSQTAAKITLLRTLAPGDILDFYEISNTDGCYVPATPAKLGLSAAYLPEIFVDSTYVTPTAVIKGHDGSITRAYGDFRDAIILELEQRIYNNIKVNSQLWTDVIESNVPTANRFKSEQRLTNDEIGPYSPGESASVMQKMFYEWVAKYQVDYTSSDYDPENPFTWNWSGSADIFNDGVQSILSGGWRGIYNYFFNTLRPNTAPWEALNIAVKPAWWDATYGPAPYTGTNLPLWQDLQAGIIRDPAGLRYSSYGMRTSPAGNLSQVIPVDASGNLLDPSQCLVGNTNAFTLANDYTFGDDGPGEAAWRSSSYYPFAKLRAQILQNPLFMCGTLWDLDSYAPTVGLRQFRFNRTVPGALSQIQLHQVDSVSGILVRKTGLLNYSLEFLRKQGRSPSMLRTALSNSITNLVYDMAGFADISSVSIYAEQSTASQGSAIQLPTEDYSLFLSEDVPTAVLAYSGILIAKTALGFKISGYDPTVPFFTILPEIPTSGSTPIVVGNSTFNIYTNFSNSPTAVPYNTIFPDVQTTVNFIIAYGRYLEAIGLTFTPDTALDQITWTDAAAQFIQWSYENWSISQSGQSLSLVLNPATSQIVFTSSNGTLQSLLNVEQNIILDASQNRIGPKFLDVYRDGNTVTIKTLDQTPIAALRVNIISYEHKLIVNNTTVFNDIIYDPISGLRENRLRIAGQKTANWTGTLDMPGFILVTDKVPPWQPQVDYPMGSIVKFKNTNYSALVDVIGAVSFQYTQFQTITDTFSNAVLPNLSLKAQDLSNAYSAEYRNYITDFVRLRSNTLGYIERSWLSDLGIDLASQTDFYRGWIKEKGSLNAVQAFGRASTPQLNTTATINEEYAVKLGDYGATERTGFADVVLPNTQNAQNPLVITYATQVDSTDQRTIQVTSQNLFNKSDNFVNDFIQPQGQLKSTTRGFQQAGPVLPQDILDIAQNRVSTLNTGDTSSLYFNSLSAMVSSPAQSSILKIGEFGGLFWIASDATVEKVNNWNVLRFTLANTEIVGIQQIDIQTIAISLSTDIGVSIGDVAIIDINDPASNVAIQGSFLISSYVVAPTATSIATLTITTAPAQFSITSVTYNPAPTGKAVIYASHSLRFNSIAEANTDTSVDSFNIPLETALFVDNDATGWASYSYHAPYAADIEPVEVATPGISQSVAYDPTNSLLWVGKPGALDNAGEVVIKQVFNHVTDTGNIRPTLNVDSDSISHARSDSYDFGYNIASLHNSSAAVSAKVQTVDIAGSTNGGNSAVDVSIGGTPWTNPGNTLLNANVYASTNIAAPTITSTTAAIGSNTGSGVAWTEPTNVNSSVNYAQVSLGNSYPILRVVSESPRPIVTENYDGVGNRTAIEDEVWTELYLTIGPNTIAIDDQIQFAGTGTEIDGIVFRVKTADTTGARVILYNSSGDYIVSTSGTASDISDTGGGATSQILSAAISGLTIPAGAAIRGLQVSFTSYATNTPPALSVTLGTSTKNVALTNIPTSYTLGGPTDSWGQSWSSVEIESAIVDFVALASTSSTTYINNLSFTVNYSINDVIDITEFGFAVPSFPGVQGFSVTVMGYATSACTLRVQMLKNGSPIGSIKVASLNVGSPTVLTVGNLNDLFGAAWTDTDVNNTNFGVRLSAVSDTVCNAYLGYTTITMYLLPIAESIGQVYISSWSPNELPGRIRNQQVLSSNLDNFGASLSSSSDGQWLFIGATNPANIGQVAAYGYTTAQQCYYTVSNVVSQHITLTSSTVNGNVVATIQPASAYSLRISVTDPINSLSNQLMIPVAEYSVTGNVITFTTPVSNSASVAVEQLGQYYNYLNSLTDANLANGSNFAAGLSCDSNASTIVVGAPNSGTGQAYVFTRLIEKAYITGQPSVYLVKSSIRNIPGVSVNGIQLLPFGSVPGGQLPQLQFKVSAQYILFVTPLNVPAVLPVDCILLVDLNYFIEQQVLSNSGQQLFGQSVAIQNSQLVVGAPNTTGIINSETILRQGVFDFYTLDTSVFTTKAVPISQLSLTPGLLFYVNGFVAAITGSLTSNLVSAINEISAYSGISAQLTGSTITLTMVPSMQTTGITGTASGLSALYSSYVLTESVPATNTSELSFGANVKWLTSDLFAVQTNTGAGFIEASEAMFVDGTDFDNNTVHFYDEIIPATTQSLLIYQVLRTNRSWLNGIADIFQLTPVRNIQVSGTAGVATFFDGNLTNLWVGNQLATAESTTLYNNEFMYHGWMLENVQQPTLEVNSISAAWLYDQITNTKLVDFELADLACGLLPNTLVQNLDYISDLDPAYYGTPVWAPGIYTAGDSVIFNSKVYQALVNINGDLYFVPNSWQLISDSNATVSVGSTIWGANQVGQFWFNTSSVKIVDAQLGTTTERAINWNTWFPGTVTNVYEWVASNVPPAQYVSNAANGFVTATAAYVFNTATNTYYFWVYNKGTLGPIYSVSSANLATQLQNIANTGIALASPIDDNRIGVWNVNQYIAAYTAVLHVDYVVAEGDSDLHSEFLLLSNSGQKSWLRTPIYQKFIDSISGQNSSGAMVPNMNLLNDQQYGTSVAPVRTIFVNRAAALLSYYSEINTQLANVAVATTNTVKLLSTKAPLPTYGFSITVPDRATLNSLNIDDYPQNYRVLVLSDNTLRNNPWSVVAGTSGAWQVVQMQSYDLSAMWEYADWTAPGFANTTPTFTINSPADFPSVSIGLGQTLGVSDNDGASNYAVYQNNVGNISVITDLDLVFLENGTLQFLPSLYNYAASNIGFDLAPFDQVRYFDDEPVNEIQLITAALNEQILVGNWSYIADAAFFAGLNYIIHENQNLDWLFKTSFITVNYPVKNLDNPTTFSATDDTTMSDFITETMPFHTRVREFIDGYSGIDTANTATADFDIPAIYDGLFANASIGNYNGISVVRSPDGSQPTDAARLLQDVYQNWSNNFVYGIDSISVNNGGANYFSNPQIIISGGGGSGANAIAVVNANTQQITEIIVVAPGAGYTSTPNVVAVASGNATVSASLYARLSNELTRKASTDVRFDRIGYTVEHFDPAAGYPIGSVVYAGDLNNFYVANIAYPTGNFENGNTTGWNLASNLQISTSTALNRIAKFYNSSNITPANVPTLLMSGLTYPDSLVNGEQFIQQYQAPTGAIYNVDDVSRALTVLNVNFDPAEVNNAAFNSKIVKFGTFSGSFDETANRYITLNINQSDPQRSTEIQELQLNAEEFTMEFFYRFTSTEIQVTESDNTVDSIAAPMVLVDMRTYANAALSDNGLIVYKTPGNFISVSSANLSANTAILTSNIGVTSDLWQNLIIQRSGNFVKLYVDGNLSGVANVADINFAPADEGLTFGADAAGANGMNGYLDEFRLTVNTLRYDFNSQFIPVQNHPFSRSILVDPFLNETYTKVLYGFETLTNEAPANLTFTPVNATTTISDLSWNPKLVELNNYSTGNLVINGTPLGGPGTALATVLTANLINSSNAVSCYIQTTGDKTLNLGINDFTVEFWYKPSNITLFESNNDCSPQTLFEVSLAESSLENTFAQTQFLTILENGVITVLGTQSPVFGNNWLQINSANPLLGDTPYYISVERQAETFYLYVNGTLQGSNSASSNANVITYYPIPAANIYQLSGNTIVQQINTANAAAVFTFGATATGANPVTGVFGDIRITNGLARHVPTANSESYINSSFTDTALGVAPLEVNIDGNEFVNSIYSYGPEEQVPGKIYDALNIQVYQRQINSGNISQPGPNVPVLGFGLFKNTVSQGPISFYTYTVESFFEYSHQIPWLTLRTDDSVITVNGNIQTVSDYVISDGQIHFNNAQPLGTNITIQTTGSVDYFSLGSTAISSLAANLCSTDSTIFVANIAGFPTPNISTNTRGVVLIGGERVTYLTMNRSLNALTDLQRGTDGTGVPNVHLANSSVISISADRTLPGDAGSYTWYTLGSNTASNGNGLANSNTAIAGFLLAQGTTLPIL